MSGGRRTIARRGGGAALGVVVLSGVLAGCGGDDPEATAAPAAGVGEVTTGSDGVQEITLRTQDDYVFVPDSFTVDPGAVRLTVVNAAEEMTHNLEFTDEQSPEPIGAGIDLLAPGEEITVDFEVSQPGYYPFACTFHVQLGQVGTMTVRG